MLAPWLAGLLEDCTGSSCFRCRSSTVICRFNLQRRKAFCKRGNRLISCENPLRVRHELSCGLV